MGRHRTKTDKEKLADLEIALHTTLAKSLDRRKGIKVVETDDPNIIPFVWNEFPERKFFAVVDVWEEKE